MPEDLCACDQSEAPDLDAWKREAGEAAPLDAAATRDWRIGGVDAGDGRQIISGGPVPIAHIRISCVTVGGCDGSREITPEQRDADAAFVAAARTGWPRDAARVARLCDEVTAIGANQRTLREASVEAMRFANKAEDRIADLEAALREACNGWDAARKSATPPRRADAETIARLRALATGGAPAKEPTR